MVVCAFMAAAQARTPAMREHQRKQWKRPLEMMEDMIKDMKDASPAQKAAMAAGQPPRVEGAGDRGVSLSIEQVKAMYEKPLQTLMPSMIRVTAPALYKLTEMAIL